MQLGWFSGEKMMKGKSLRQSAYLCKNQFISLQKDWAICCRYRSY